MSSMIIAASGRLRDALELRSMRQHRSLVGWRDAPRYTRYFDRCRQAFSDPLPEPGGLAGAIKAFRRDGVTSFLTDETQHIADAIADRIARQTSDRLWETDDAGSGNRNYLGDAWNDFPEMRHLFEGPLNVFLTNYFQSWFKILYGTMYRSRAIGDRVGSQMWHSDSGPGICVNVMFYLQPCRAEDGALEALPWAQSLRLYVEGRRELRRNLLAMGRKATRIQTRALFSNYFGRRIAEEFADYVVQPTSDRAGLVVPFLNNALHRGGFPVAGRTRTAIVFHCYPSHQPTNLARYDKSGIKKTMPYPQDPAMEF